MKNYKNIRIIYETDKIRILYEATFDFKFLFSSLKSSSY